MFKKFIVNNVVISNFFLFFYFLDWFIQHTLGKRRKLNTIQNDGRSQAKEQSIESSTEANQHNNSIIEENA